MKKNFLRLMLVVSGLLAYFGVSAYDFEVDGFYYNIISSSERTVEITSGTTKYNLGEVTLPSSVTYKSITFTVSGIGKGAFKSATFVGIKIPNSIKNIGFEAFDNASSYNKPYYIVFSNSDIIIDSQAFDTSWYGTFIFESKTVPTITGEKTSLFNTNPIMLIPEGASELDFLEFANRGRVIFYGESINLLKLCEFGKNKMEFIDNEFTYVVSSLVYPYSAQLIGINSNAESLVLSTGVAYSDIYFSVNSANENLCNNNSILKKIVIPEGYVSLVSSFKYCTALKEVYLPSTINTLKSAFLNCRNLQFVISKIQVPFETDAFDSDIISLFTSLRVPKGTNSLYKTTAGWSDFSSIEEDSSSIEEEKYNTLYVQVSSGGIVNVLNNTLSNRSLSVSVKDGEDVTLQFTSNSGYCLKLLTINGLEVLDKVVDNTYTVRTISENKTIVVTFAELPTYLAIKNAENGSVSIVVEKGNEYTTVITPSEGWKVNTVSFNGTDVTSQLKDNTYTTPPITGDSELAIVYKLTSLNAVKSAVANRIKVSASYGEVTIDNNSEATTATVYSINGAMITTEKVGLGTTKIRLDSNKVYIIKVGTETFKVVL